MDYILALIFPWLSVMLKKRMGAGIGLLLLQITIIGWPLATLWAFFIINQENKRNKVKQARQKALLQKSFFFQHWKNKYKGTAPSPSLPQKQRED